MPDFYQRGEIPMSRLFELRSHEGGEDLLAIIDLDKICVVHVEKEAGHHYLHLLVRFVDGHETSDLVPPEGAQRFLDAYRDHLRGSGNDSAAK
jgi:hypothetical protein